MLSRSPVTAATRLARTSRRMLRALLFSSALQALLTATAAACSNGNGFPN